MKNIINLIIVSVSSMLVSCSAPSSTHSDKDKHSLTLVTYNVGAFNKAGYDTMPICLVSLKELNPDAVALNELDSCNTRCGTDVFQLEKLAAQMGNWPFIFASAIPYKKGTYGIGAMTAPRHKVLDKWTAKLPKSDGREVRALAVIETDSFVFCSTHLDLTDASQAAQVEAIASLIGGKYHNCNKPVFLCGDMNAEPGSATILKLQENWNLLSSTDFSFSTSNPRKCIDFIFAYKNAKQVSVTKAYVIPVKEASDHFPQMVKVEW